MADTQDGRPEMLDQAICRLDGEWDMDELDEFLSGIRQ
jgi:hypothetical protein